MIGEPHDDPDAVKEKREREWHRRRHLVLNDHLRELFGDFAAQTGVRLSEATVLDLMSWSDKQAVLPDHKD